MSVNKQQGRARGSRTGKTKRGMQTRSADGLPWAFTPEEAAAALGVPLGTIQEFTRLGWLHPLRAGETLIAAHLVRRLMSGRPY
jgi:hypothetical protein